MKKKNIFYYSDLINDDFGGKHKRPNVYDTFKFKKFGLDRILCDSFTYGFATPIIYLLSKIFGYRNRSKKNFFKAKIRKGGYFIYSNHCGIFDVSTLIFFGIPKRVNFVGYSDPLTIPVAKHLVRALGFIPLPTDPHDLTKYQEYLRFFTVERNEAVVIFPEAHIWPEYDNIRPFGSVSFRYPSKFMLPVLPVFYLRRPKVGFYRIKKKNPVDVYVGEFIYPKPDFTDKENAQYLRNETYKWMKNIVDSKPHASTSEYVYVPKQYNPNYINEKEEQL